MTAQQLAAAYVEFGAAPPLTSRADYRALCEESLREYVLAARWVLGERTGAYPAERIWAGLPTCAGQMTLLPLAALYAGQPEAAYLHAYQISFFDNGTAKDVNSAIVAGLAAALAEPTPSDDARRRAAWQNTFAAMRSTDPYRYADVPFAGRPVDRWLDFAAAAVERAGGSPQRLFKILEQEGEVRYFWEAHFTFAVALACAEMCDYRPLPSLQLVLDFGHDTDSSAQLLGAFCGALHGPNIFPREVRDAVAKRLQEDYRESVDEWVDVLTAAAK